VGRTADRQVRQDQAVCRCGWRGTHLNVLPVVSYWGVALRRWISPRLFTVGAPIIHAWRHLFDDLEGRAGPAWGGVNEGRAVLADAVMKGRDDVTVVSTLDSRSSMPITRLKKARAVDDMQAIVEWVSARRPMLDRREPLGNGGAAGAGWLDRRRRPSVVVTVCLIHTHQAPATTRRDPGNERITTATTLLSHRTNSLRCVEGSLPARNLIGCTRRAIEPPAG